MLVIINVLKISNWSCSSSTITHQQNREQKYPQLFLFLSRFQLSAMRLWERASWCLCWRYICTHKTQDEMCRGHENEPAKVSERAGFVVAGAGCRCVCVFSCCGKQRRPVEISEAPPAPRSRLPFRRISKREILNCTARIRFYVIVIIIICILYIRATAPVWVARAQQKKWNRRRD